MDFYIKAHGGDILNITSVAALITVQWLYSESLTQFRSLIKNSHALGKDYFLNFVKMVGQIQIRKKSKQVPLHKYKRGDTAPRNLESNSPFQNVVSGWHPCSSYIPFLKPDGYGITQFLI